MQESKTKKEVAKDRRDRRRSLRFKVTNEVTGRVKPTMAVRILDVSQHGMLIDSPCGLPPAGICELTIDAPNGPVVIRGKVARCRAQMMRDDDGKMVMRYQAGLEFAEEIAEGLEIQDLISQICTLEAPGGEFSVALPGDEIDQAM
jgi:hypothetical protein